MRISTAFRWGVAAACLVWTGAARPAPADDETAAPKTAGQATASPKSGSEAPAEKPIHERDVIVAMWKKNNELRASVGLPAHRLSPELCKAAQDHAEYMARTGVFDHYANGGPSGRAARHGYRGSVRENIAMGYGSVESAFAGWRSSGGHWASIVSGTQDAGFGYAVGPGGAPYYVGVYGYAPQRVAKPVVDDPDAEDDAPQVATQSTSAQPTYSSSRRWRRRGRRRR